MISLATRIGVEAAVRLLRGVDLVIGRRPTEDLVVMISRQHRTTSGDFARIRKEIARASPSTRVVVLNHRSTRNPFIEAARILQQTRLLGAARAAVVDTYIIPVSVLRPRPHRPVVQIWHASGAIKRFGVASVGTDEGASPAVARGMRMHRGYSAIVAGGPDAAAEFRAGFGVPAEVVVETGQPRHDRLGDPEHWEGAMRRLRASYPDLVGRGGIVVYAPTMRRNAAIRWELLSAALQDAGYTPVICRHPLDGRTAIHGPGVVDGSAVATSDWLAVADHLVTDYSALAFDSVARDIPTWLFTYDIDDYRRSPGLFTDPTADLVPITSTSPADLVARIARHDASGSPEAVAIWDRLRAGHWAVTDGLATRRLVGLLGLAPDAVPPHPSGAA
ncbi:CDP-glycerol glycerophosphotransferase family protein [Demequina sp. SYSU T00039]|uniref:CDP-glycerol glycerophosphotransferase family protein n=1 Tax=Demequina lignilytica TaxID=3051663 RepID=A0AAW7M0H9_9MICO|nr:MULTISPECIES: CDP-glycerol glycerophosphotransferase family protein [unclassified Demequina]MDN4477889.1 CDP-glycerol glycerophosphotransferase family protein [Demequina sp. SYSU T00039-1]MDN4487798.1 CDP-glycerol glycerophosphotransferase family protein [Demequina sp. SYSU T00039]